MREAVESSLLRLTDNANAPNSRSIAAATATTFVTQFVADALMREVASPSGAAAAEQGWPVLNDLLRGVINTVTQTTSNLLNYVFVGYLSAPRLNESQRGQLEGGILPPEILTEPLDVRLEFGVTSVSELRKAITNIPNKPAARALTATNVSVLSNVIALQVIDKLGLNSVPATLLKSVIFGVLNGFLAPVTAYSGQQRQENVYDLVRARAEAIV
jgi:hypothetical protein